MLPVAQIPARLILLYAPRSGRRSHHALQLFQGPFVWHSHEHEDELFYVVRGAFRMEFRDRQVELQAGDMLVVPRGVEHRPVAEREVEVLLFEPAATVNTGTAGGERTVAKPDWI